MKHVNHKVKYLKKSENALISKEEQESCRESELNVFVRFEGGETKCFIFFRKCFVSPSEELPK